MKAVNSLLTAQSSPKVENSYIPSSSGVALLPQYPLKDITGLTIACSCLLGKYLTGDEAKISPPPSAVCEDFPQAVDLILQFIKK